MKKLALTLAALATAISLSACTVQGTFTPADESVTGYWYPSE